MAAVTIPPEPDGDRGQLLLVTAFGVAVMLVALALILNTSIYTENVATRGSDITGGKDAIRYRAVTEETTRSTLQFANYNNNSSDQELRNTIGWTIENYSEATGDQQARDGIVTNTTLSDTTNGTRVYNTSDGTGNFSDATGARNWTVVQNTRVRNFTIEAEETSLTDKSPTDVGDLSVGDPAFRINVTADVDDWYRIYIYKDGTDLKVTVEGESGGTTVPEQTCTRTAWGSTAEIDITAGTVEGSNCETLQRVADIPGNSYDVDFNLTREDTLLTSSNTIEGNYSLVAETTSVSSDPPNADDALYSATVHVVYESKRLYYETDIRVAPGEFDG